MGHLDGRRDSLCCCDRLGSADISNRPPGPILGASAFVAAVFVFIIVQPALYAGGLEPIWRAALAAFAGYTAAGAFFVSAMLLLAAWHAFGAPIATARGCLSGRLLFVLAALLGAYVLVYFIFTGYIRNGYFLRYLP